MANPPAPLPPNSTARGWAVIGQEEHTDLDQFGRPTKGMLVRFQTAQGVAGSVFIPQADYRVETVRAAVAQAVSAIDAVHQLRG
jgi:hypothetical protein